MDATLKQPVVKHLIVLTLPMARQSRLQQASEQDIEAAVKSAQQGQKSGLP